MVQLITSKDSFATVIKDNTIVVVDFYADWCGPCRAIAPEIEKLEKTLAGKVVFCKVNVDNQPEITAENEVTAMPTFRIFVHGVVNETIVGANLPKITQRVTSLANNPPAKPATTTPVESAAESAASTS